MINEVDVIEWLGLNSHTKGSGTIDNMPHSVYAYWFSIYTGASKLDRHQEFSEALSAEYLDISHRFTRQSCKKLSCMLVTTVNCFYQGKGIKAIFED